MIKKILILFIVAILIIVSPVSVFAKENLKFHAITCTKFNPETDINNILEIMPMNSFEYECQEFKASYKLRTQVESSRKERRFH